MLFNNFRKFDADATNSGTTDPTQNPNPIATPPTGETPKGPTDAEINMSAMRKQNEKLTKELESFKNAQSNAEKLKLEEEGKFKELLEKERAEKLDLQSRVIKNEQQAQLSKELMNAGLSGKNLELAKKQIAGNVDMSAADATTLIQNEIKQFQTDFPSLFVTPPPIPAGSSSVSQTTGGTADGMSVEEATRIAENTNATEYFAKKAEVDAVLMSQY